MRDKHFEHQHPDVTVLKESNIQLLRRVETLLQEHKNEEARKMCLQIQNEVIRNYGFILCDRSRPIAS